MKSGRMTCKAMLSLTRTVETVPAIVKCTPFITLYAYGQQHAHMMCKRNAIQYMHETREQQCIAACVTCTYMYYHTLLPTQYTAE